MAKAPKNESGYLYDAIATLEAGMNAGIAPLLLQKNQVAFATNCTFRGGFVQNRPPFRKIPFDYGGDVVLQSEVETQFFQGACFYQSDFGTQHLVAQIGGRLFLFTPSSDFTTFVPLDVSIPGDLNPSTTLQAWLFQAERWVIVNDGQSLPIFFDGVSSRRSFGPSHLLATVAAPGFTAPAIGASVQVNITSNYGGPFNIPVLVNDGAGHTANYTIMPPAPGPALPNARLKTLHTTGPISGAGSNPNILIPIGAQVLTVPSRIGVAFGGGIPPASSLTALGLTNPPVNQQIEFYTFTDTPPLTTWAIGGTKVFKADAVTTFPPFTLYDHAYGETSIPAFSPVDELITYNNPTANTLVGTVVQAFTTANRLSTVDIILDVPYTGPDNSPVWINNMMFTISAIPSPGPQAAVTLINGNDTVGFVYNPGATINSIAELPTARMGTYGLGRIWLSLTDGRSFMAGDIVGGSSGSLVYSFRDAILKSTENSYLAGGGNFVVPGSIGDIQAMIFTATLDVALGQGPLQVFTRRAVFSCMAPVDRTVWQSITNPILTNSLIGGGAQNQNATINANGDTLFRAIDGLRSLILARREFDTWGNVPQSREVQTVFNLDDSTLFQFGSAIVFDNRLLMTCIPTNGPRGVYHQGLISLNFDEISSLRGKAPSIYDGFWTGLDVLQVVTGVFSGVERAYAFCFNESNFKIELFELLPTGTNHFDNGNLPITMSYETSVFFRPSRPDESVYLRLEDGEIWVSDLFGVVTFQIWFRADDSACWTVWRTFSVCADNSIDGIPQFRPRMSFGMPTKDCDPINNRPFREGYYFQLRVQITGACTVKRIRVKASPQPEPEFAPPICGDICVT